MPDPTRDLFIQQGVSWASTAIRTRQSKLETEPLPEPDRPALREAEALVARQSEAKAAAGELEQVTIIPGSLFGDVEGREAEKQLLERALRSRSPVHVLLVGDPGCGKSELLQDIGRLPRSRYAIGGATSSSGMLDYLLEKPNTERLVIDELDKAEMADLYALYSLMESGQAPRLQHGKTEVLRWRGWVFAGANSIEKLPEALRSRFVIRTVPSYTQEQMQHISARVLERREGLPRARAREIAAKVAARSRDPRDAIQVARLAGASGPIEPMLEEVVARRPEQKFA